MSDRYTNVLIRSVKSKPMLSIGAIFAVAVSSPLSAQSAVDTDQSAAISEQVDALRACRSETEDALRLACYDTATRDVLATIDDGKAQLVMTEEVEKTRRGLFGFSMPKLGLFSGKDGQDMELLESTITRVRQSRRTYEITIDEGSVWRIANAPMRLRQPKAGDPVAFKKASMGSFFVRIDGQMGVKGTRIR